ncbi:MAG: hypothetical protein K6B68_02895 [Eubacterium sp.]|nr:hypothetical protein [Eubacterium sp.]
MRFGDFSKRIIAYGTVGMMLLTYLPDIFGAPANVDAAGAYGSRHQDSFGVSDEYGTTGEYGNEENSSYFDVTDVYAGEGAEGSAAVSSAADESVGIYGAIDNGDIARYLPDDENSSDEEDDDMDEISDPITPDSKDVSNDTSTEETIPLYDGSSLDSITNNTPGTGSVDGEVDNGMATSTDAYQEEPVYHITQDTNIPAYEAYKNISDWKNRKSHKAPDNTYVLTACTGAKEGDSVLYFSIEYKDKNNITRQQFLFPHVDGFERSNSLLNYYADGADIKTSYGKKIAGELNYKVDNVSSAILGAYNVQDFAFKTEAEIKEVISIDIYLDKGSWNCGGLSIYSMKNYKGLEEYGMISGQQFLDFEGELIADATKTSSAVLSGGGIDKVFHVGGLYDSKQFSLRTFTNPDTRIKKKFASDEEPVSFRMDFADVYDGGLECLLNSDAAPLKSDNGIVEDISLGIQYKDIHGWTRKVTMPVILNSFYQARRAEGDSVVMGLGQRGETLAFQAMLPEFSSLYNEVEINVGGFARSAIEKNGVKIKNETAKMSSNRAASDSDKIRLSGLSVYKGGCMPYTLGGTDDDGNKFKGSTLYYSFENEGSPIMYYTTTQEDGREILSGGKDSIKLSPYQSGELVAGQSNSSKFLVNLRTGKNEGSGSSSDFSMRFHYKTLDGSNMTTPVYWVKDSANQYMGKWPTKNGDNFVDTSGLVTGGNLSFLIEADNLMDFTGVEINLGKSPWTMENLSISYIESYEKRKAYRKDVEVAGDVSNYWIERSAISAEIFSLRGSSSSVTDEDGNVVNNKGEKNKEYRYKTNPDGSVVIGDDGKPVMEEVPESERTDKDVKITGDMTFKGDSTYKINFDSNNEIDVRTTKYSEVRYKMSWAQTQVNWGFFKKRKIYNIAVKVAKDSTFDTGNGDSGSTNHFYFQLVFKNGNSGYVLANQQITSDGFRSGYTENFTIATNQNYGEVKGIRIIPEDLDSNSDPFDKLNIDRITVSENNSGGSYVSYVIDKVGWIEIQYRDELESITPRGQRARLANEISKYYKRSYKEKNVKLVCEVYSEAWAGDFDQFVGSMKAEMWYISATTGERKPFTFDVVQAMGEYMDIAVESIEAQNNPDVTIVKEDGLGTLSNRDWMFRSNHMDRMIIPAIPDLKSIESIQFTGQNCGEKIAKWRVKNVSIVQVVEDGAVQLTTNNELYRNISYRKVCTSTNTESIEKQFTIGGTNTTGVIPMSTNEIIWNETDEWATPVARLPESTDDKINIFVYPTLDSKNANNASVNATLQYTIPFSQYKTVAIKKMDLMKDMKGRPVYRSLSLNASDFVGMGEFSVYCMSEDNYFDYAVIQHVKEGVVVGNYVYNLIGASAVRGATGFIETQPKELDQCHETVAIGFDAGTKEKTLQNMNIDMAVAFDYVSTLDGQIYSSPFKYLTDDGYTSTYEGLFAELTYDVPNVYEIVNYNVAGYGNLEANIAGMASRVYEISAWEYDENQGMEVPSEMKSRSFASCNEKYAVTDRILPHKRTSTQPYGEGSAAPVKLTFNTAQSTAQKNSASKSAVRMKFHYTDYKGNEVPGIEFADVTKYIQGKDKMFLSGETQVVKLFLPDMNPDLIIKYVDIIPYNSEVPIDTKGAQVPDDVTDKSTENVIEDLTGDVDAADTKTHEASDLVQQIITSRSASWTIKDVSCDIGLDGNELKQMPARMDINQTFDGLDNGDSLRLFDMSLRTTYKKNKETEQTVKDNVAKVLAQEGDVITGKVITGKSDAGFKVSAFEMVGDAPKDVTTDTIKKEERFYFTFTTPENYSGETVVYKIEVTPNDAPDLKDTIEVYVQSKEKNYKLTTNISKNNDQGANVENGLAQIFAEQGDEILGTVLVEGSEKGFTAKVYKVTSEKETDVTKDNLTIKDKYSFSFVIPTSGNEEVETYKIVIALEEKPETMDTVMITVTPKKVETVSDDENSNQDTSEEPKNDTPTATDTDAQATKDN